LHESYQLNELRDNFVNLWVFGWLVGRQGGEGRFSCVRSNVEIMHMVLDAFPSNPCIINSFLGLRFMKSLRCVSQTAWQLLPGKEGKWKDARVNRGKG
jgi:hypothetical protein